MKSSKLTHEARLAIHKANRKQAKIQARRTVEAWRFFREKIQIELEQSGKLIDIWETV